MLYLNGRFPFLSDHLDRLKRGADRFEIKLPGELQNTSKAEAYLRSLLLPVEAPSRLKVRLQLFKKDPVGVATVSSEEFTMWNEVDLIHVQSPGSFNRYPSDLKTTDRSHYSLWFKQAVNQGVQDALICLEDERIVETTIGNIITYQSGRFIFPEDSKEGIEGIFLHLFRQYIQNQGIPHETRSILVSELFEMEGVWLGNAVRGPLSIRTLDGILIPQSKALNDKMTSIFTHLTETEGL
jgi:branched-subunit amino acid aminotransferase/4-amino-4-deoxychorismate lyase